MRDIHNELDYKLGAAPAAAITDNTAVASQVLNMTGLKSAELVFITGTDADTDATFTVSAKESNTGAFGGEETDVADSDMIGTEALAGWTYADDNKVRKLGFRRAGKLYKKVTVTPANNTGNVFLAMLWLTDPDLMPTANPPA